MVGISKGLDTCTCLGTASRFLSFPELASSKAVDTIRPLRLSVSGVGPSLASRLTPGIGLIQPSALSPSGCMPCSVLYPNVELIRPSVASPNSNIPFYALSLGDGLQEGSSMPSLSSHLPLQAAWSTCCSCTRRSWAASLGFSTQPLVCGIFTPPCSSACALQLVSIQVSSKLCVGSVVFRLLVRLIRPPFSLLHSPSSRSISSSAMLSPRMSSIPRS